MSTTAAAERPKVSVIVVTYGHPDEVRECLLALRKQTLSHEVIVVDNSQGSEVQQLVRQDFAEVRFVRDGTNDGYAGGNNRGLAQSTSHVVMVLNPDTVPSPDALRLMYETLMRHPKSLITAKLIGSDGKVNACGNQMHFSGLVTCLGLGDDPEQWKGDRAVFLVSGAAVMADRTTWDDLEGFDSSYFLYMEDADLSLRARLLGREVWCAADAEIVHRYALNMTADKFHWLVRNRWMTMLKIFSSNILKERWVGLLVTESLLVLYAISRGPKYVLAVYRAYAWVFRHRQSLAAKSQAIRATRVVLDRELTSWLNDRLPYEQLISQPWLKRIVEKMADPFMRMEAIERGPR